MRLVRMFAALSLLAAASSASAYTLTSLHSFCTEADCRDGSLPIGGLVADATGNLYGVTGLGGKFAVDSTQGGTVFQLHPNGDGTYTHTVLHNFCARASCADGNLPFFGLIVDATGTLYGTTQTGGANNSGVMFRLVPNLDHTDWNYRVLHDFCGQASCTDGNGPAGVLAYQGIAAGVPFDGVSPLYITTAAGGAHGAGAVVEIDPVPGASWPATVLYSFCVSTGCPDGSSPRTGVTVDATNNLYGVTYFGGANHQGALFKLTNIGGVWSESVLSSFCNLAHCHDGQQPSAVPLIDGTGTLYGATIDGGANGKGTLYSFASGNRSVFYDFCPGTRCTDGANPERPLIMDGSGNLFGATLRGANATGGNTPHGKAFEWNGSYSVIHDFCTVAPNCADGDLPSSPLLLDNSGNLFGETLHGGAGTNTAGGGGTVYQLTP